MEGFTIKKVVETYKETGSARKTAELLNVSWNTVAKCLSTCGIYHSKKCADANRLRIAGWSKEAICEELGINPKTYDSYMPYIKGSYLTENKTKNAEAIARHRKK